jgi:ubiquinone/menaquinone biosynthesis C-methylase UbiE
LGKRTLTFEEGWRKRFDEFARFHEDDAGIAGWSESGLRTRLRNFARVWGSVRSGALWLDAGCGAGTYSRFVASSGQRVVGLDYSQLSLVKARSRNGATNLWVVGDVKRLPLKPETFDGVLCFGVTQALTESATAVTEIVNVVKPGGEVWLDALNRWCLPHWIEIVKRRVLNRPMHLRYESPRMLRKLLVSSGLEQVKLYWLPMLPGRFPRCQRILESAVVRWAFHHLPGIGALLSHAVILSGRKRGRS